MHSSVCPSLLSWASAIAGRKQAFPLEIGSKNQWRSQPKNLVGAKNFGGAKMLDFRRISPFCLAKAQNDYIF